MINFAWIGVCHNCPTADTARFPVTLRHVKKIWPLLRQHFLLGCKPHFQPARCCCKYGITDDAWNIISSTPTSFSPPLCSPSTSAWPRWFLFLSCSLWFLTVSFFHYECSWFLSFVQMGGTFQLIGGREILKKATKVSIKKRTIHSLPSENRWIPLPQWEWRCAANSTKQSKARILAFVLFPSIRDEVFSIPFVHNMELETGEVKLAS